MGSTSIIAGEVIAPTSSTEVSTASVARGGISTLASVTGGEVTTSSIAPRGGTCGSGDLVREGDDGATGTPCGLATGLHGKAPRQDKNQMTKTNMESALKILPRHRRKPSLRPKHPRLNSRRHPRLRCCSTTLHLQSTTESILRHLLYQLSLPLGSRTLRPPCCLILRDWQLLDRLILLLLLLLF
jgi:hypothetical protein